MNFLSDINVGAILQAKNMIDVKFRLMQSINHDLKFHSATANESLPLFV